MHNFKIQILIMKTKLDLHKFMCETGVFLLVDVSVGLSKSTIGLGYIFCFACKNENACTKKK